MAILKALPALLVVGLLSAAVASAQTVYTRQGGRVVEVPISSGGPVAPGVGALPAEPPAEGGMVRIDGLPAGASLSIDGQPLGGAAEVRGGWISLAPGPHFIDVALPGGTALRLTVVTPVESSGYQVTPRR